MSSFAGSNQKRGRGGGGNRGPGRNNSSGNGGGEKKKRRRRNNRKKNRGDGGNNNNNNSNSSSGGAAAASAAPVAAVAGVQNPNSRTSSTTRQAIGTMPFSSLAVVPEIKRAMAEVFGYAYCTKVQEQSIPVTLRGGDVLAKAKTGTGKTIAFLIPALHKLATARPNAQSRNGRVSVLIISPTRELASQIEEEAKQLTRFMGQFSVQCVYGGTNVKKDLAAFKRNAFPDVLIATPGRLNDHLENNGLGRAMQGMLCLIFDEADQLLEMGFRPAITRMLNMLPPKNDRQTILFSATMPADVMGIARFALRDQFEHVDCVGKDDQGTHKRVPQFTTVYPLRTQFSEIAAVLTEGMREPDFKIMIFFVTARLTQLHAELFALMGFPVVEIHSRKSQSARTKASTIFREQSSKILFSSDVSARGMDYPDVTMVCQVGLPDTKAQYIHRLGRTARAGKTGIGVLMLGDFEQAFINKELRDQPLQIRAPTTPGDAAADMWLPKISNALSRLQPKTLITAYQAWLGYYNGKQRKLGWNKNELVRVGNSFALLNMQLPETPALMARTVGKMGLKGVQGLRVEGRNGVPRSDNSGGGGGGRGGRNNNSSNNQRQLMGNNPRAGGAAQQNRGYGQGQMQSGGFQQRQQQQQQQQQRYAPQQGSYGGNRGFGGQGGGYGGNQRSFGGGGYQGSGAGGRGGGHY